MSRQSRALVQLPFVGPVALSAYRASIACGHLRRALAHALRWWLSSRETSNFTYALDAINERYLVALLADVTERSCAEVQRFVDELHGDRALEAHVRAWAGSVRAATDLARHVRFGRRIGWYAAVRALKPRVVVETGVDKGLGACVIAAALLRNAEEGAPGRYWGTDINPQAGGLFSGRYAETGAILYGDSVQSLAQLEGPIDLFINDSDHSAAYEALEYRTVRPRLSERAVILGDNAHVTDELAEFAMLTGRRFVYFQERPQAHWYPGGGIGIAFTRGT